MTAELRAAAQRVLDAIPKSECALKDAAKVLRATLAAPQGDPAPAERETVPADVMAWAKWAKSQASDAGDAARWILSLRRDPAPPAAASSEPGAVDTRPLHEKFIVRRTDGRDAPGEKHHGCRYFVIDIDHDENAKAALAAYARSCESTRPQLARDLGLIVAGANPWPLPPAAPAPNPEPDAAPQPNETRDLIAELRGGIPDRCSFCDQPTAPNKLHPEEAGDWVCETCMARWDAEDAEPDAPAQPADAAPQPVNDPYQLPDRVDTWLFELAHRASATPLDHEVAAYLRSLPAQFADHGFAIRQVQGEVSEWIHRCVFYEEHIKRLEKERDEARAEVERLSARGGTGLCHDFCDEYDKARQRAEAAERERDERAEQVDALMQTIDEITVACGSLGLMRSELPAFVRDLRAKLAAVTEHRDNMVKWGEATWKRLHPQYGPCDAMGADGACSACLSVAEKLAAAEQRVSHLIAHPLLVVEPQRVERLEARVAALETKNT